MSVSKLKKDKELIIAQNIARIIVDYRDCVCSADVSKRLRKEARKLIKIIGD